MNASRKGCGEAAPSERLQRFAEARTLPRTFNLIASRYVSRSPERCLPFLPVVEARWNLKDLGSETIVHRVGETAREDATEIAMRYGSHFRHRDE